MAYSMADRAGMMMNRGQTVLIVEDQPIARFALNELLLQSGFNTRVASSAEEALAVMKDSFAPYTALIDLDLPGMDGAELLRRLRAMKSSVYAIVISGAGNERVRERFGYHTPYLRKPVDFENLLQMLTEIDSEVQ